MIKCCGKPALHIVLFFVVLGVFLLPCRVWGAEQPPENMSPKAPRSERVILLLVDGLGNKMLQNGQAPNCYALGQAGLKVQDVYPLWPDRAGTATASVLTGLEPDRHGYTSPGDPLRGESLMDRVRAQGHGSAFFDGTGSLEEIGKKFNHHYKDNYQGKDSLVIDQAIKELERQKFYLTVIFLPQIRSTLDKYSPDSKEVASAIANTDSQVGRLIYFLQQGGYFENSFIVLTGTSGIAPLILKGPEVKSGASIPAAGLVDIAPTVTKIAGLPGMGGSGLVLWDALQPGIQHSELELLEQRVKDLSKANGEARKEIYRAQEEKAGVKTEQSRMVSEKNVILKEIEHRDQQIAGLQSRIRFLKHGGIALLLVFLCGCLYEYRYLKKKFLLFS